MSRITESILARQLDDFQKKHRLVHKGIHGFRRERGTNTAMLETWEYVLHKTEKGDLVALDFLDVKRWIRYNGSSIPASEIGGGGGNGRELTGMDFQLPGQLAAVCSGRG